VRLEIFPSDRQQGAGRNAGRHDQNAQMDKESLELLVRYGTLPIELRIAPLHSSMYQVPSAKPCEICITRTSPLGLHRLARCTVHNTHSAPPEPRRRFPHLRHYARRKTDKLARTASAESPRANQIPQTQQHVANRQPGEEHQHQLHKKFHGKPVPARSTWLRISLHFARNFDGKPSV
jgi:hypothetical protein